MMEVSVLFVLSFFLQSLERPAVAESPPSGVAIYRSAADGRAFAYSGPSRDFKAFYGPYRANILKSDIGGFFQIEYKDGVGFEKFTGISLPIDFPRTSVWQSHGYRCSSKEYSKNRWIIRCSGPVNLLYLFEKDAGMTGFYFPCG